MVRLDSAVLVRDEGSRAGYRGRVLAGRLFGVIEKGDREQGEQAGAED